MKAIRHLVLVLSLFSSLSACAPKRAPIPQGVIPDPRPPSVQDEQYGHQVLGELTQQFPLEYNDPRLDKVVAIVDRLSVAAKADKDPWHVYLLKDDSVKNAAATRGNHVFIWTGMLDAVTNDDELAGILGHEVAHVLARHTDPDPNEEAKKLLISVGALAASIAVAQATSNPMAAQNLGNLAGSLTQSIGEGVLVNPYGRELEHEADRLGMLVMAEAGYDPKAVIVFWERAQQDPSFSSSLQFFSTHPVAEDRLKELNAALPDALQRYEKSPLRTSPSTSKSNSPSEVVLSLDSSDPQNWIVKNDGAKLYSEPNLSGKPKGEFKADAVLTAKKYKPGWYRVTSPDRGFIQSSDISQTP